MRGAYLCVCNDHQMAPGIIVLVRFLCCWITQKWFRNRWLLGIQPLKQSGTFIPHSIMSFIVFELAVVFASMQVIQTCYLIVMVFLLFQEKCVRLFDRGDLNSYKDELGFVSAITHVSKQLPIKPGAVPCEAVRQELLTHLNELIADVRRLTGVINSRTVNQSFAPKYQRQCVEDAVTLVRKTAAIDWLQLVLRGA
jgi:hypothetical protein